jgi:hypothetical protein
MSNPAIDTDFQIATYAAGIGGLATLRSLGVPNPRPVWVPAVDAADLGDNSVRWLGAPVVMWRWGFVSQTARDVLKTFCPGAGARVYVVTPTTENLGGVPNAPKTYLSQMIWVKPSAPENPQAGRRLEFQILFRQMVVQP